MMYERAIIISAVIVLGSAGAWKLYHAGGAKVKAECNAEKLTRSESARLAEKAKGLANQRIDNEFQLDKARRAAFDRIIADRLRDFQTTASGTSDNTATSSGIDDPYPRIASECAAALSRLDSYASSMASTAKNLQGYASEVCVNK